MDGCVFIWHISEKALMKRLLKSKKQTLQDDEYTMKLANITEQLEFTGKAVGGTKGRHSFGHEIDSQLNSNNRTDCNLSETCYYSPQPQKIYTRSRSLKRAASDISSKRNYRTIRAAVRSPILTRRFNSPVWSLSALSPLPVLVINSHYWNGRKEIVIRRHNRQENAIDAPGSETAISKWQVLCWRDMCIATLDQLIKYISFVTGQEALWSFISMGVSIPCCFLLSPNQSVSISLHTCFKNVILSLSLPLFSYSLPSNTLPGTFSCIKVIPNMTAISLFYFKLRSLLFHYIYQSSVACCFLNPVIIGLVILGKRHISVAFLCSSLLLVNAVPYGWWPPYLNSRTPGFYFWQAV